MEKQIKLTQEYLYLPVCAGAKETLIEVFVLEHNTETKILEMMVPIGEVITYKARFPMKKFIGKTITLKGDFSETYANEAVNSKLKKSESLCRPSIHFTAQNGWINDPNGLVFADGIYHLYFQYNPCNISWNNMSWGHAISTDLLHWEEQDSVLWPDENGMMFSGCGLKNDLCLLQQPKSALLFFYTAAGGANPWSSKKEFTQRLAISTDGGNTLLKADDPILDTICKENRDPKIFWHEETQAYIMVLWLEKNDFAIFRSDDLANWEETDRLTLPEAWECPDMMKLSDDYGNSKWIFLSADGFYFWGEFDGYHFTTDYVRHEAYLNRMPYAAQTYAGVTDRVISVPWLRIENDGRPFTGAMGIPMELSIGYEKEQPVLVQKFVRELYHQRRQISTPEDGTGAHMIELRCKKECDTQWGFECNADQITYDPMTGILQIGEETAEVGKHQSAFTFVIDDRILSVSVADGRKIGMYTCKECKFHIKIDQKEFLQVRFYEIK